MGVDDRLDRHARRLRHGGQIRREICVVADLDFAQLAHGLSTPGSAQQPLHMGTDQLVVGHQGVEVDQQVDESRHGFAKTIRWLKGQRAVQRNHRSTAVIRDEVAEGHQQRMVGHRRELGPAAARQSALGHPGLSSEKPQR